MKEDGHTTEELDQVLNRCRPEDLPGYLEENPDRLYEGGRTFTEYMRTHLRSHELTQQEVFLSADIPERYGYKLISGEKHTRQRDIILRICLAAHFTLNEAQTALKLYGMAPLYSRIPRDAAMIIAFNTGMYDPYEVNRLLEDNHLELLAACGET